jgi:acylpyruvate hydrolase
MKIICIGLNYADHIREFNSPRPTEPIFFLKPDTALLNGNKPFFLPDFGSEIHYEVEIVLKVNRLGRNISEKFAERYFTEIGIGIDFTARDIQKKCRTHGLPWEVAKAFDGAAPIGEFVPKEKFQDINNLNFRLNINGTTVQKGNTHDMIFNFDQIIHHVSKFVSFRIGDLIFTGTPVGVGPVKIGDRLQAYIEDELLLDFYVK